MPPGSGSTKAWDGALLLVVTAGILLAIITFRDYGVAWDDPSHVEHARWVLRGGTDTSELSLPQLGVYGSLFDVPTTWLADQLGAPIYDVRHLCGGLLGVLALLCAGLLARQIAGPRAGALAALMLLVTPRFFGHTFINCKDAPFAVMYLATVLALASLASREPGRLGGRAWLVGIGLGCTLAVRVGGIFLLAPIGLVFGLGALGWLSAFRRDGERHAVRLARSSGLLIGSLGLASGIMFLGWPYIRDAPIARTLEVIDLMSAFFWDGLVLFDGEYVNASALPRTYGLHMLAITFPLVTLIGIVLAAIAFVVRAANRLFVPHAAWIAAVAIAVPLAVIDAKRSVLYDGIRHLLFVVPLLTVLAAAGWVVVGDWIGRRAAALRLLVTGSLAALLALPALAQARLHPYEYIYFNELVGGVAGADGRYELDYWGTSGRELGERLVAAFDAVRPSGPRPVLLIANLNPDTVKPFLGNRFRIGGRSRALQSDGLVMATPRWGIYDKLPGEPVLEVRREGALLGGVKTARPRSTGGTASPRPAGP